MQFEEMTKEIKSVSFDEIRSDEADYFEAVVTSEELANLNATLTKSFGTPVFLSKEGFSSKVQETIREFGGVWPDQTLYVWSEGSDVIFAMLWPWQDKEHTTLKIVKK